ncbi:hypothetical protein B0H10DRAFT_2228552 [Mycena sp. CBHHK59/15]|nr:hypothetical protein B0H10DRAFT_2228552 [Mycena sp. CBHHK59/15]
MAPLRDYFHRGKKHNSVMWHTYCKGCLEIVLFGGAEKPRKRKPSARVMEEEEILMQALAEADEDDVPDDGAIEIESDEDLLKALRSRIKSLLRLVWTVW